MQVLKTEMEMVELKLIKLEYHQNISTRITKFYFFENENAELSHKSNGFCMCPEKGENDETRNLTVRPGSTRHSRLQDLGASSRSAHLEPAPLNLTQLSNLHTRKEETNKVDSIQYTITSTNTCIHLESDCSSSQKYNTMKLIDDWYQNNCSSIQTHENQ
jgi:hypothetical protein